MIIGSGSALFEMVRYLTEREPVLVCPAWFFSEAQPIAIRDVLSYLIAALDTPDSIGRVIEIGGPTRLTYADMLLGYAKERGLKRWLIRTPFYAPRLSAYWVHMVTPIHWRIVLPLIEGLRANLIVRDDAAKKLFPQIQPIDFQTAVHLALGRIQRDDVETSWADALVTAVGDVKPYEFKVEEGMFIERHQVFLDLAPEHIFRSYMGIGGDARLAVLGLGLGFARLDGQSHRRSGPAARPSSSRRTARGRGVGFLACGGGGTESNAPFAGGNESAGQSLA